MINIWVRLDLLGRGVEVYYESVFSGKLRKIITSSWPTEEIGDLIPNPEYGKLNRIEYTESWINVYIEDAKKSNLRNYIKKLEEYGFTENKQKNDNKNVLEYKIYNKNGDYVMAKFFNNSNLIEINANKK